MTSLSQLRIEIHGSNYFGLRHKWMFDRIIVRSVMSVLVYLTKQFFILITLRSYMSCDTFSIKTIWMGYHRGLEEDRIS